MFDMSETERLQAIGKPLRQRSYKDPSMDGLYLVCLGRGADDFMRRRGGSIQGHFMDGYNRIKGAKAVPMSWGWAAFQAGKDRRVAEEAGQIEPAEVKDKRLLEAR